MSVESPQPPSPAGRKHRRRSLALVGLVGPVLYMGLTLALGLLWDGYDPIRDTQSELGAVNSPFGPIMNVVGFMGLGVTLLAFAAAYSLVMRGRGAKLVAVSLIVLAGVGMVTVGFFPCDPGCVDVTRTGRLHGVFSAPGAIGLPLAAMVSSLVFRVDGRFGAGWQLISFWGGLASLVSGPVIAVELIPDWNGLLQRLGMWLPLIWVSAVSSRLLRLQGPLRD